MDIQKCRSRWISTTKLWSTCASLRYDSDCFAVSRFILMDAEMGTFVHACESEMVCESTNAKVPYFNAPIYTENKVGRTSKW